VKRLALTAAAVLIAACSRDIQNTEAVRLGVVDYLRARTAQTGLDMNLMQVDVTSISFQGGTEARATVAFRPKNVAESGAAMTMNYTLDRKGDKWVVRGHGESGGNPHGAPAQSPASALPPGHPPVSPKQ
jgi:hypothetical protein